MTSEPVIFVHSAFRTGSTWFQSRFRRNPGFCTFTEAYNEQLAGLTLEGVYRACYQAWNSRHPPSIPYFTEYAPLLRPEGGVEGFDIAFSFERYFPAEPGTLPEDERAYLERLIGHARGLGRVPVITFTRSLGRVAAIKAALGGFHIFTHRNLFNQWCSYTEFAANGSNWFLATTDRIIAAARDERLKRVCAVFSRQAMSAACPFTFLRFVLLHLFLYGLAARASDAHVYMEDLALPEARARLEHQLRELTGQAVDFSGYRETRQFSYVDLEPSVLQEAIAVITDAAHGSEAGETARLLQRARDALLASFMAYRAEAPPLLHSHRALYERNLQLATTVSTLEAQLASKTLEG